MKNLLIKRLTEYINLNNLPKVDNLVLESPKKEEYGDYSTNIAFIFAKSAKKNPQEIANRIAKDLSSMEFTAQAIGGFLNFTFTENFVKREFEKFLTLGTDYFKEDLGKGKKVILEFVSANPTGPMHIGHGRGAVVGDVIAKLLKSYGYNVYREYYINDAGYQVHLLGLSVFHRYLELFGIENPDIKEAFEKEGYKGLYIVDLAKDVKAFYGQALLKEDIGKAIQVCSQYSVNRLMEDIKHVLKSMNVIFDSYFSERSLLEKGLVKEVIEELTKRGFTYEKDGALWFRSTDFGDDKDRVLIRSDGTYTYFANDVAYHYNKYKRDFEIAINIWGADHHGYLPRLEAALKALGIKDWLKVEFVQMVRLLSGGQEIRMSKRTGEFITLKELIEDVGQDAVRFMFLTKRSDTPLDFDIDIVKEKTSDNPVFYVQYAHARIMGVTREVKARYGIDVDNENLANYVQFLSQDVETKLMKKCLLFKDVLIDAAENLMPHIITYNLISLAKDFHNYYNHNRVLVDDKNLMKARLALFQGIGKVINYSLKLIGVEAPSRM